MTINLILNNKSETGDRILWARFASIYLHRSETTGCNSIYPERENIEMKKKRKKSRMIGTYAQGKREKWNSILRWSRMHSVTVYTFGE